MFSPQAATGLNPGSGPASSVMSYGAGTPALAGSAGSAPTDQAPPWNPDNPLFWFAGILLVTVGAIAANATVRVGKFKAGVGAGST